MEHELKHLAGRRMQIVVNLLFKFFVRVYSFPFAVDFLFIGHAIIHRVLKQFGRQLLDGSIRLSQSGDQQPYGKVERAPLGV